MYKDNCNNKTNQKNIGTIKSSNLCTEIIEYSDSNQYACCTLGSLGLPSFIDDYDFNQIKMVTIFTKENCKFCRYTKKYLKNKNISFEEFDFIEKRDILDNMISSDIEIKTVPQIFISYNSDSNEYGFDKLINFLNLNLILKNCITQLEH